ncbi:hypothetical protein QZH41_019320 [Actinostola sp. cb2023]|nr:hypothetical protein QZH41_019320 [Actinostola sp. cb2023]
MLRASADPYLVLRFQNWCGLREIEREERHVKDDDSSSAKLTTSTNGHVQNGFANGYTKNGFVKNGHCKTPNSEQLLKDREMRSKKAQRYEYNPFWHAVFMLGSTLGNEVFYITFFPFLFWNIDEYIARRLVFLWALLLYCGQCAKDIIQWPRPPCPPVIAVEKRYQWEYGMPSTHAMVGALIPFTLVFYSYDRYQYPLPLGIAFIVCWCLLVCSSRMYMGMHSLQDVIAGLILAIVLLVIVVPMLDIATEAWILSSPSSPIFMVAIPMAMCIIYPTPPMQTDTRADTTMVVGTCVGAMLASWARYAPTRVPDPYVGTPFLISFPGPDRIMTMICRFILGILIVVPSRSFMKSLIHTVLPRLLPKSSHNSKGNKEIIELVHRFVTYSFVAFNVVFVVPRCFVYFGI